MLDTLLFFLQEYILKIGFLILNGVYILFLFIIYQQTKAMSKVVNDKGSSSLINYFALVNILIGILIFVAALVIL